MLSWIISSFLLLLCLLRSSTFAQNDPINNFCRQWGHQSAIVDGRLYVDGGLVNYEDATNNVTNTFLSYNDIENADENGLPPFYGNLSKNDTIPSVNGGILWEDSINKRLYLYGGEYHNRPPAPPEFYSYDILYNEWVSLGAPPPQEVQAASYGAGVSISSRGEAYYYGGWLSNASIKGWSGPPRASNGLIKYEMDSKLWSNLTGPDEMGRAEGAMVFIPAGDSGMLVYFGGGRDLYGNGTLTSESLDQIYLFDLSNGKWYTQKTTGDTPNDRRRFCGGATWPNDHSSYNIYIYGGRGFPPDTAGYDDIYILTIPSFQWIRGPYPTYLNGTGTYPKSMMSCNVVNDAQMLVIGGTYSNVTDELCDVPTIQGRHNMNLGRQNKENAIWGVYQPNLTTYVVPIDIRNVIGGKSTGAATKTVPADGFDDPDLAVQMERTATTWDRTATRATATSTKKPQPPSDTSEPSSGLSTGAIAGIAVGCSLAFILASVGCGVIVYRRRKFHSQDRVVAAPPPRDDMVMTGTGGWAPPVAPSDNGGQTWPTHPPFELASEQRSPDRHQRMSPKSDIQVTSRGGRPAELDGEGNIHEYQDGLSPLSETSQQNHSISYDLQVAT